MKKLIFKGKYLVFGYILLLMFILLSPFWLWAIKGDTTLNVLIFDKTVPDQDYREHKGLVWLLNNQKYIKNDGKPYSNRNDYFGFIPTGEQRFEIKPLPKEMERYDVIYLTDQYGVYEEEFYGNNPLGKRSESLYGGLQVDEVEHIERALMTGGKTLIAEFNTFASPTELEARMRISNLLNVNWSGWIGRYFPNLASGEVPIWVKENYRGSWDFNGPGLVFVDESDFVVVVESKELTANGVPIEFTQKGQSFFNQNLDSVYRYWFDIVESRNAEEVLANFNLPVTEATKNKLHDFGIPTTFPAVNVHKTGKFTSYYFSGDFADEAEVPGIYQTRGFTLWKKYVSARDSFYWNTYVPMMKYLLDNGLHKEGKQVDIELINKNNITYNSQTVGKYIQVMRNGNWEDLLIKGVNMGIAKPGYFPGETAITKDEYIRWFKAIGEMNANTIRVYTLHPPSFYEALYEYNQIASSPIYLLHGAWVSEESLVGTQNAFSKEVIEEFETEMKYLIDIIHGNAELPERRGHANGIYKYDVSKYVLGFILGIEWDPQVVYNTNLVNSDTSQFKGQFFQTENASPFEIWLAQIMEQTAVYEAERYNWQHSVSFTNWVTTDLLEHPAEPAEEEDFVSVNPNHIQSTKNFYAGMFASYHIYPYYPDFFNYEEKYLNYKDQDGNPNNYAGYLNDLIKVHDMPVLVAEFGVPSSRGLTHVNAYGMNQGFLSEQEQGEINSRLFKSIMHEGYAGGLVFSWQDEWFKRTWNTMDLDNPYRRPYWSNVQTNEQRFGMLSFDPDTIVPDGIDSDWKKLNIQPLYKAEKQEEFIQEVKMHADPGYLYYKFNLGKPVNWEREDVYLLLDTIPDQGQNHIETANGKVIKSQHGIDFKIELTNEESSKILVDSYYDPFYFQYGEQLKMIDRASYANKKNNGVFHPIRLALNKELVVPSLNKRYPFQAYETGKLMFGNANPKHKEFNSLTDISISRDGTIIEIRLPWQLLNVKDPSQKEMLGDLWKSGMETSMTMDKIQTMVVTLIDGEILNEGISNQFIPFTWEEWEQPIFKERLKNSYFIMKEVFKVNGKEETKE